MIFLRLFLTFLKIGIFTFGGGLSMVALIQDEVVNKHQWMTTTEYTDILAISQMTPGPVGINVATYAGYTAVVHEGYSTALAIVGAILASLAVVLLPALLMMLILTVLSHHRDNADLRNIFSALSLTVVGIVASAALGLVGTSTFGTAGLNRRFIVSLLIFLAVFALSMLPRQSTATLGHHTLHLKRPSPILLILLSGLTGLIAYSL